MKNKYFLLFFVFLLSNSCNDSNLINDCLNLRVYLNTFEQLNDVANIKLNDSLTLYNDNAQNNGKKCLKICYCCNQSINIISLPKITKAGEYQLKFWAKNIYESNYGSIKLTTENDLIYSSFIIKDTSWKQYYSEPIYFELNTEPRIVFWITGSNNSCILIDNIEFIKLN